MELARDELLMKLGSAKSKVPAAWRLVDVKVEEGGAGFTYKLNRIEERSGHPPCLPSKNGNIEAHVFISFLASPPGANFCSLATPNRSRSSNSSSNACASNFPLSRRQKSAPRRPSPHVRLCWQSTSTLRTDPLGSPGTATDAHL
jgi:hypothetical protein